jgi:feruloyl esterase
MMAITDATDPDLSRYLLRKNSKLLIFHGMRHCGDGPGCNEADPLEALVAWVEKGVALDYLVAHHRTNGSVDNERRVCAWPQKAVYVGPAGGHNDRVNWVEKNFACRPTT